MNPKIISTVLFFLFFQKNVVAQNTTNELPPLPPPTEAQLQRGRELLDKIIYVIDNVPLTDAAAVLKVLGFTDLMTHINPTYTWVEPKGKNGGSSLPADLVGTGWVSIQADPMRTPSQFSSVIASLEGDFSLNETCVHVDQVRQRFAPRASETTSQRMTYIHPNPRPPMQHQIGHLGFRLRDNRLSERTRITFTFEYQLCAKSFSFSYSVPEGSK